MTLTQAWSQLRWNGRISLVLLDGIGAIALVLALVGLYAVTAFACNQRRKELAVRVALGAQRRQIGATVFRRVMHQLVAGIVVGLAGTFAFDRFFTESGANATRDSPCCFSSGTPILIICFSR